jgi:hypothetical protein
MTVEGIWTNQRVGRGFQVSRGVAIDFPEEPSGPRDQAQGGRMGGAASAAIRFRGTHGASVTPHMNEKSSDPASTPGIGLPVGLNGSITLAAGVGWPFAPNDA